MSTSELLYSLLSSVGGALMLALAHYISTGKPPLFDPENKYPIMDLFRDCVRRVISLFGPKDPQP